MQITPEAEAELDRLVHRHVTSATYITPDSSLFSIPVWAGMILGPPEHYITSGFSDAYSVLHSLLVKKIEDQLKFLCMSAVRVPVKKATLDNPLPLTEGLLLIESLKASGTSIKDTELDGVSMKYKIRAIEGDVITVATNICILLESLTYDAETLDDMDLPSGDPIAPIRQTWEYTYRAETWQALMGNDPLMKGACHA